MEMKKAVLLVLLATGCFSYNFGQMPYKSDPPLWLNPLMSNPGENQDSSPSLPALLSSYATLEISCSYYQKKSIQRERICSMRVSPICATNNVTYPNSCVYCFAHIALNFTLRIQFSGEC